MINCNSENTSSKVNWNGRIVSIRMPSQGWNIQRETDPPEQKSELCNSGSGGFGKLELSKSADKAAVRAVSELLGCNASEHTGSLENKNPGGRAFK